MRGVSHQHIKFPWGKYSGRWMREIPTDYLKWVIMNYTNQQGIAQLCADELTRREPKWRKLK